MATGSTIKPGGVLDRILEAKAARLREAKLRVPAERLIEQLASDARLVNTRSFLSQLSAQGSINIIAEVKHRSPSKGVIRANFDPVSHAISYVQNGAAALSVLAEEDFFGGSLDHLRAARKGVDLPLLRKDFIFDDYQIYESAVAGADALLLIVAMLDDAQLNRLLMLSHDLKMEALVEVHTLEEMKRAAHAGARIIGVNNRDLTTFKVDLQTSVSLAAHAPGGAVLVSESGINSGGDIRKLRSAGFQAFLVGERLMRAEDPGHALKLLIEDSLPAD